jgi:hypothetical protein
MLPFPVDARGCTLVSGAIAVSIADSLEAWPERESVTVFAHTSDHSVKVDAYIIV